MCLKCISAAPCRRYHGAHSRGKATATSVWIDRTGFFFRKEHTQTHREGTSLVTHPRSPCGVGGRIWPPHRPQPASRFVCPWPGREALMYKSKSSGWIRISLTLSVAIVVCRVIVCCRKNHKLKESACGWEPIGRVPRSSISSSGALQNWNWNWELQGSSKRKGNDQRLDYRLRITVK